MVAIPTMHMIDSFSINTLGWFLLLMRLVILVAALALPLTLPSY